MVELQTDGNEYEIIDSACEEVKDVSGIICEIGTYLGGGMATLMKKFHELNQMNRTFIGVDPYGDIMYLDMTGLHNRCNFTNRTKSNFLSKIYELAFHLQTNFIFFNLTDEQFFKRFGDGIPVYNEVEELINSYALVSIDGPHAVEPVLNEFRFFCSRMVTGGVIVFDDINQYEHNIVDREVLNSGFILLERGHYKYSYKKVI